MNNILIRKATDTDLPVIGKLMAELIATMDNTEGIDTSSVLENCRKLLSNTNSHFLVAEIDEVVIGFINFTTRKTVLHDGPSGLIDELVITKSYRSKGVGKQLISAVIKMCRQLGCCEIEVSTEKVNIEAKEFYRKCGFEERGVLLEMDLYTLQHKVQR